MEQVMIRISENAVKQVSRLRANGEAPSDAEFLRVKVVKGGCSGMSYKLDFDHAKSDSDQVFEEGGVKVLVDSQSLLYIAGMVLDYEGGLNGKGFIFSNPNASKTCGCGNSFKV
jgi:iron-sulfur cluster assembly protein